VEVYIFEIGGMMGGLCGGMIEKRFGRKGGMIMKNLIGIVGDVMMG
jgi:SP family facilitated glucose transporter-like MFS transporter 1